jgi:hypothetical protein
MPKKMYKELIELIEKQSIGRHVTPSDRNGDPGLYLTFLIV